MFSSKDGTEASGFSFWGSVAERADRPVPNIVRTKKRNKVEKCLCSMESNPSACGRARTYSRTTSHPSQHTPSHQGETCTIWNRFRLSYASTRCPCGPSTLYTATSCCRPLTFVLPRNSVSATRKRSCPCKV